MFVSCSKTALIMYQVRSIRCDHVYTVCAIYAALRTMELAV